MCILKHLHLFDCCNIYMNLHLQTACHVWTSLHLCVGVLWDSSATALFRKQTSPSFQQSTHVDSGGRLKANTDFPTKGRRSSNELFTNYRNILIQTSREKERKKSISAQTCLLHILPTVSTAGGEGEMPVLLAEEQQAWVRFTIQYLSIFLIFSPVVWITG